MSGRYLLHLLIIAIVGCSIVLSSPSEHIGGAAHYGIGVMEHVADVRGMERVPCMVSSPYEKIGTWLRVTRISTGHTELCEKTVDVSAPQHRATHIRRGIVVELGWPAARRLCGLRRVNREPPWACQVKVTRIR